VSDLLENLILNPVEFTPELDQIDLNDLGLSIAMQGLDYGESSMTVQRVRQSIGEGITDANWPPVEATVPLIARGSEDLPIADPLHRLEAWVAEVQQKRSGWIRRDFSLDGGFAGSVGCPVDMAGLTPAQGWNFVHDQVAPDVILKISRYPIWFATVVIESAEFKGVSVRDLEFEIAELLGTAPGLLDLTIKNEGAEDWRGCRVSLECDSYSAAATAKPKYEAAKLSPKGGAVLSAAAAPEVRAIGAVAAGTGAISPGLPAGTVAGDLLVMVAESGGAAAAGEANTALTAAGWTEAPNGSEKKGNTRLTTLFKIAVGGDATLTNDTGDHQMARIIGIKAGTFDPAAPFNISAKGTQALTKAVSIPGATTTRDNCLIIAAASGNLPDATTAAEFSAVTNAGLTGLTERIDNTTAEGDGGAIFAATGVMATHGTYATTTVTAVTEAERAVISLAVNPIAEVVKCPPLTAGWQTVLSSEIVGVGHMTHVDPRRMWFRVEDPSTVLNDVQWKLEWRQLGAAAWIQTMEASTPIIESSPVIGGWQQIDLGECRPERAIRGLQRWEFRLQARSLTGSGKQPLLRDVYPESVEQWAMVSDQSPDEIDGEAIKPPGTVEDSAATGTVVWVNPGNAKAEDGNCAVATAAEAAKKSHYLQATNFGFAIPPSASIVGIAASVRRRAAAAGTILNGASSLIQGGALKGTKKEGVLAYWPTNFASEIYGGHSDLWGLAHTPTTVNSKEFGFAFTAEFPFKGAAEVDEITVTVAYAEFSNGESRICFASRSVDFTDTGIRRQHLTEDAWGDLVPEGVLLHSPSPGQAGQPLRGLIVPSVGDFAARPDATGVKLSGKYGYRPGYLFAREAA
jgi:hypothetical protein